MKYASVVLTLLLTVTTVVNADGVAQQKAPLSVRCQGFMEELKLARRAPPRQLSAERLAELIAVDPETQKLVSNPWIAQYLYVKFFADQTLPGEGKQALQDIVEDEMAGQTDIYDLINNKLATKLNDPQVQQQVREAFAENDFGLRPGPIRARTQRLTGTIRQAKALFTSIARIKKFVFEGFSQATMDLGLFDFYGATQLGLKESQLRAWSHLNGGLSAIRPGQIINMSPEMWSRMALMASETEKPIEGYSTNSGDALRAFMPSLSLFMGKTQEQDQLYRTRENEAKAKGQEVDPFCTNVWCREENRHESAIQNLGERTSGIRVGKPKTYEAGPATDFSSPEEAIKHLIGRNSSEWNANSAYFLLRAHSEGAANELADNVRQDETKHMAIFSAAAKYIFGNQPGLRMRGMIEKIMALKAEAATSYSDSTALQDAGLSLFELGVTHFFVEWKTRQYMRSLPLKTLEKFFDSPVKTIKPPESDPVPADKQALIDEIVAREKLKRERLERWKPDERERYLALERVEKDHGPLIENLITHLFNNFAGAEDFGSPQAKAVAKQIGKIQTGLDRETNSLIRMSLLETLRDYQIVNSTRVRNHPELVVRLKSAAEGFVVEKMKGKPAQVVEVQRLTGQHALVRVNKPDGFKFEPGMAVTVTVQSKSGFQSRTLSVANSPNQPYLDFAVGVSDSDFKQKLSTLKAGEYVFLEPLKNQMPFKPDVPTVMIAGGIGITPFRSMIQYAMESKSQTPLWLFYGNRSEIPFEKEINGYAQSSSNFNVIHTLSKPGEGWQGRAGRIDEKFLSAVVPTLPKNAMYYVVGAPEMVSGTRANLIRLGVSASQIKMEAFIGTGDQKAPTGETTEEGQGDKDKMVCFCHSVTSGQIMSAIAGGATTLAAIQTQTNASTGCGGCKCNVEAMLRCVP